MAAGGCGGRKPPLQPQRRSQPTHLCPARQAGFSIAFMDLRPGGPWPSQRVARTESTVRLRPDGPARGSPRLCLEPHPSASPASPPSWRRAPARARQEQEQIASRLPASLAIPAAAMPEVTVGSDEFWRPPAGLQARRVSAC